MLIFQKFNYSINKEFNKNSIFYFTCGSSRMEDSFGEPSNKAILNQQGDIKPSMLSDKFLFILITATGIGVFMGALDGSIVNVSLPSMAGFFHVDQGAISWVVLIYLIIMAGFTAIAGKIGDKYSNKLVFQVGMLIFTIGSLMSFMSNTLPILIFARIVQAVGATGLTANGIAIITRFTTSKNRGTAIGWNSIFVAMALTLGPVLGGVLTQFYGWQSIFIINVPIGIIGLVYVQYAIPPTPPKDKGKQIDMIGAFIFGLGIMLLVGGPSIISLINLETFSLQEEYLYFVVALVSVIVGIIFLIIFYETSKRKAEPVIDIGLMKERTFDVGIITATLVYGVMEMITFQLPFLVIFVYGFTFDEAGLALLGIPLAMALVGPIAGRLSDKYDPRYITAVGTVGLIFTMIAFALTTTSSFNWFVTVPLTACLGASVAMFSSPNGNSIMSSVPKNRLGLVGGFIGIARTFGFSLGIAVSAMVMVIFQPLLLNFFGGTAHSHAIYILAYQAMAIFGSLFAIVSLFITFKRPDIVRSD